MAAASGSCLPGNFDDDAVAAGVDGVRDLAVAEIEDLRSHLADLAEVGDLAIAADEVAALDGGADGLCGRGEVTRLLDLRNQCVGPGGEQLRKLLIAEVVDEMRLVLVEVGGVGGADIRDLEDGIAFAGRDDSGWTILLRG